MQDAVMPDDTVTTSWKRLTDGEATGQAVGLATWEDEGGTTSSRDQAPAPLGTQAGMDWNLAEANWQQFKHEVLANWGRLTAVHLDVIAGRRACLSNEIKEAYGVTDDEAERQIKSFEARNQHPRTVSFR
jgi:uncharacterized protein YjbJ (UPF0337 family)